MIRRLRPSGDQGWSLPEMLVAMMISGIILVALSTLFVSSLRQNTTVSGRTTSTADARIAMEALTRDLRVAVTPAGNTSPFVSPGATPVSSSRVSFYSSLGVTTATADPKPSLITFYPNPARHCLIREVTPYGGSLSSTCVARGDFNLDGSALFTYYGLNPDGTVKSTPFATSAITSNLPLIASVGLSVSVTDTAHPAVSPTNLQDQVTLINVATSLQAGLS